MAGSRQQRGKRKKRKKILVREKAIIGHVTDFG
jgi:hypothetical protein